MENCHCQDEHMLPVHGRCLSQLSWGRGSVCSQGHVANGYHISHERVLPTCVFPFPWDIHSKCWAFKFLNVSLTMSNQHDRLNSAKEKTFVYKYTYNIIIKWWIIVTIVHNSHHHNDDNIGMVFFLSILASPVSGMSRTAFPDPFRPSSRAWWRSKFASFVPGPGERHRIHHGCWIGGTILQRQLVENFYLTPSKKRFPLVETCHSYPQFFIVFWYDMSLSFRWFLVGFPTLPSSCFSQRWEPKASP